jgi:eukaryotic-like serine/threonine-protein kinase
VQRDSETRLSCRLNPAGTTPPGFVFIAGGAFWAGGDPKSFAGFEGRSSTVGDFWIQEREMVFAEWLPFLNDPAVRAEIDRSETPIRYPRDPVTGTMHPKWTRAADGTFSIPPGRAMFPLSQVSIEDVEAYLKWRNARAAEDGSPFEFALPTELEWEKAARGADRRAFVFGDVFAPTWVKGRFGHAYLGPELVLRFPRDESPYGVFDMTGSMWEACSEPWSPESAAYARAVRGGEWNMIHEANFRAASRAEVDISGPQINLGFRLVMHRRSESR